MHNKYLAPALAGLIALSFASSALAGVTPTVVRESGSDNQQLFATIGNRAGRLEWSPSAGWANTWALHPNNSGVPAHRWRGNFTALSWYDINVRPTGLIGGPQIESYVGYYNAGQPRVGRFRLSGDYGMSYQWNPHWSFGVPPGAINDGFFPQAGYAWFDNGVYRRHVFGNSTESAQPLVQTYLREHYFDGQGWQWRDHGMPSLSSGLNHGGNEYGANSVVRDPQSGRTWVFTATRPARSPFTVPELFAREFDPASAAWQWVSLGEPYQAQTGTRIVTMNSPVAVARETGGVFEVRVFTTVARDDSPFVSKLDHCCVLWELWERRFDGTAWQAWVNHGALPNAVPRPPRDRTDVFLPKVAFWHSRNGAPTLTLVAAHQGDVVTLECTGTSCTGPIGMGRPPSGQALTATTAFSHSGAFEYAAALGSARNGDVWEMYRDSRDGVSGWQWRQLFAGPGTADDWDGDGIPNFDEDDLAEQEPALFGCLDRYNSDSDGDSLSDYEEINDYSTSPCATDTDGDGFGDFIETRPEHSCVDPTVADMHDDADGDGLSNGHELGQGSLPCSNHSDADPVPDGDDNCPTLANPSQDDLDGDGIGDACDGDIDGDGCPNRYDPTPADIRNPTRLCPMFVDRDATPWMEELDPRLADPRLRDLLDGLIPRLPEGGIDCRSCPPFDLLRVNEEAGYRDAALKLAEYGVGEDEAWPYTAMQIADLDGDGISDLAIGLPGARNARGAQGAGVVLLVSTATRRELARFEGDEAGASLGSGLAYEDGLLRVDAGPGKGEPAEGLLVRLDEYGIDNRDAGGDPESGLPGR